tara:strand:+ start:11976 stop:12866 length:891 start_codon:yes stop_codon:yes gene_type:complete
MKNKIVIGTWPTSGDWGSNDISEVVSLYRKSFYEYGFYEYDTAPNYGNGFSEFLLGKIFENEKVKINTKVGNLPFGQKSFEEDDIKISIEQSLKRLNRSSINILFLHNPRNEIKNYDKIISLLNDYKSSGVIKGYGISCAKGFDYEKFISLEKFDYVQDDINLLCLDKIINYRKYKYYARSPLASGLLSGKINKLTLFEKSDHRSDWLYGDRLNSLIDRVKIIQEITGDSIIDISSRFLLHSPKIHKVIFGIRKISHLDRLITVRDSSPLGEKIVNNIFQLYKNDFGLIDKEHLKY